MLYFLLFPAAPTTFLPPPSEFPRLTCLRWTNLFPVKAESGRRSRFDVDIWTKQEAKKIKLETIRSEPAADWIWQLPRQQRPELLLFPDHHRAFPFIKQPTLDAESMVPAQLWLRFVVLPEQAIQPARWTNPSSGEAATCRGRCGTTPCR